MPHEEVVTEDTEDNKDVKDSGSAADEKTSSMNEADLPV